MGRAIRAIQTRDLERERYQLFREALRLADENALRRQASAMP